MQRIINIVSVFIIIFFASCKPENPPERNKLVFIDSVEDIIMAITKAQKYIKRFPEDSLVSGIIFLNYENHNLTINEEKVGVITFNNLKEHPLFKGFSDDELKEFIVLTEYLYKNNLEYDSYFINANVLVFIYRDYYNYNFGDPGDFHTDLLRLVILDNNKTVLSHYNKILDKKIGKNGTLLLLAFKTANIWEN